MPKRQAGRGHCIAPVDWEERWEEDGALTDRETPSARTAVLPAPEESGANFQVPTDLACGTTIRRQIQSLATDHCMSPADTADLVLAVSEAFNNAVRHGTSGPEDAIEVWVRIAGGTSVIELRYLGEPFAIGVPELPPPAASSGRGRYIMAMLVDEVAYRFDPPWTVVRLVKNYRLHPTPQAGGGE